MSRKTPVPQAILELGQHIFRCIVGRGLGHTGRPVWHTHCSLDCVVVEEDTTTNVLFVREYCLVGHLCVVPLCTRLDQTASVQRAVAGGDAMDEVVSGMTTSGWKG